MQAGLTHDPAASTELAPLAPPMHGKRPERARIRPIIDSREFSRFSVQGDLPTVVLDYAASTGWLPETSGLPDEVELFEPMGDPSHYCFYPSQKYASGRVECCGLTDGFLVHFNDVTLAMPQPMAVLAPDILRVRIASDGDGEYVSAHGDRVDFKGPGSTIIVEPAGMPPAKAVAAGYNRSVTVYIHRTGLQGLYTGREHELPAVLQAFVAGNLRRVVAQRLPLSAVLLRCLEDLQGCNLEGRSRRLLIGSKAVEILCHAFTAMVQDDAIEGDVSAQIKCGVIKAQQRLNDDFVTPPSLDALARDVGLSRSSLCTGFRQIIGQTVFDYIGGLRMRRALSMLNERAVSITQIAYAVGYNHPSSFSLAVQRRFGTTPSELRRRGAESV